MSWAFVAVAGLLFVYLSTRPVLRLRTDPPPSFYDASFKWNKEERQDQNSVAQAYWRVAVHQIQGRYSPESPLPADPPPQFRISQAAGDAGRDAIASRVHYWYRLREVWRQRDAWAVSYRWNTGWVENSLDSLEHNSPRWVSNSWQAIIDWVDTVEQRISSGS